MWHVSDNVVCHLTSLVSRICTEAMSLPISSLFTCPSLFSVGVVNDCSDSSELGFIVWMDNWGLHNPLTDP